VSWELHEFLDRYQDWVKQYAPSDDLKRHVLQAIKAIAHNPFAADYNGYFYSAVLPGCVAASGEHVTCTWVVLPNAKIIRMGSIVEQRPPVEFDVWFGDDEIEPESFGRG
jgi:hypothetical protein